MSETPNAKVDFAKEFKELEAIADWFEADNTDLNLALAKIERGMELAQRLKNHLETVKTRVDQVKRRFDKTTHPGPR